MLKFKLLVAVLLVSLLANAAGITFFAVYWHRKAQVAQIKKQKDELAHQLNIIQLAGAALPELLAPARLSRQLFISHADNQSDYFALAPTAVNAPKGNITLFVYLHGMNGDYLEPFRFPKNKPLGPVLIDKFPTALILSCNYRHQASFGNDLALSDITQNIRQICLQYPIKKIILVGTSMGGMTVLNYGAVAPSDIQEKIGGIVSIEGTGDLLKLYEATKVLDIRTALVKAFGGTPQQVPQVYKNHSFIYNIHRLPSRIKVCVISSNRDSVVPPNLQDDVIAALDKNHNPNKLMRLSSAHVFVPDNAILDGIDFVD
jgi:pimeloyl-ACP methyl ester carboxylesterase